MKINVTLTVLCIGMIVSMSGCVIDFLGNKINIPIEGSGAPTTLPAVVCNPPYIRFGTTCCLDQNGNGICDRDETAATQPTGTTVPEGATETTVPATAPTTTVAFGPTTTVSSGATTTLAATATTTLPAEEPTTTVSSPPTTTVPPEATTTTLPASTTTTTSAAIKSCALIIHPTKQAACDAGSCGIGYKCTYHPEYIVPKCTCDLALVKATTTTTTPLILGLACGVSSPACNGICSVGQYCATTYTTGPGGIHIPIGCGCKTSVTTTSTTTTTVKVLATIPGVTIPKTPVTIPKIPDLPGLPPYY